MKKIFFFAAAALMSTAMFAELQVADFENINLAAEQELKFANDTTGFFESGSFEVQQTVAYEGTYVSGAVISSHTDTDFESYLDANKSIAGGAYEGQNYVVFYVNAWGDPDKITLKEAAVIPGMYVCNNVYAYNSMKNGDATAGEPFGESDWFKLTVHGYLNGKTVNASVFVDLAEGTNIIDKWTYVDLTELGQVDALSFEMSGSRTGQYGLNTPSYFCIDNLGAEAPTEAISNTNAAVKAVKTVRNGQVVIIRGDKTFNVLGAEL